LPRLGEPGGPFFDPAFPNPNDNPKVKQIAQEFPHQVRGIDEAGDPATFPGKPADKIPGPYPNDTYARGLNGGALPPVLAPDEAALFAALASAPGQHALLALLRALLAPRPEDRPRHALEISRLLAQAAAGLAPATDDLRRAA